VAKSLDYPELRNWRETFRSSPTRWTSCGCGHLIDRAERPWQQTRRGLKRYVSISCWVTYCDKCVVLNRGTQMHEPGPCKGSDLIPIPDDPAHRIAARYPQHESTAWRDRAQVLPRFNGAYAYTLSKSGGLLKTPSFKDRCLYFTDSGIVYDVILHHSGYNRDFQERALRHAPKAGFDTGGPDRWRGLYQVDGRKITCSLTEINGAKYGFTGTISADGSWIGLKRTDAKGHKGQLLPDDHTFRAIEGMTPDVATPPPPPASPVVIRTGHSTAPAGVAEPGPALDSAEGVTAGDVAGVAQDVFDVILESAGRKQVAVIKAIRASNPTHVGLSEAKDLADNAPALLMQHVDQGTAARAKTLLEEVGATVTVRPDPR
jgi:large subunit ribosomal protein L7/L12